jgi:polysaccharide biosynthesis protein PslA
VLATESRETEVGQLISAAGPIVPRRWRPRNAVLRARVVLLLVTSDALAIIAGFVAMALLRGALLPDDNWLVLLLALVPVYLGTAVSSHAYASSNLQDPFRAISKAMQSFAIAVGGIILAAFYLKTSASLPRLTIALGSLLAMILLACGRLMIVRHMARLVGGNPFSVVVICDGVRVNPRGATTVMFASDAQIDPDRHDPAMYDRLATALQAADRVVVGCAADRRRAWAHLLKGANVQSEIIIPELTDFAPLGVGVHAGEPTLVIANGPLGLFDRLMKRVFDVTLAMLGLIVLSPLLIATAIAVKLDSPGPILFRQVRIGRGNQMFEMLKFRSMRNADHSGARSTSRDDDRVTRVGRIIRMTSIDELPQLLNVLTGSMSIVGPRPHALGSRAEEKLFWDIDHRYWHRHATKPGLTGLAQVRGYRGATMVEDDLRNRLQADLEYLEDWSIWRDVKIMFATVRVVLHRNAY